MGIVTPGFWGRRRSTDADLPPGQHLTQDFPVLSAGPTPGIRHDEWHLDITTEAGTRHGWTWSEFLSLPMGTPVVDIHCVTSWSKLQTAWEGVSLDTVLADVETTADFVMVHS